MNSFDGRKKSFYYSREILVTLVSIFFLGIMLLPEPAHSAQWYTKYGISGDDLYTPSAVPNLINALDDRDQGIGVTVCKVLAKIGPDASESTPKLISKAKDTSLHPRFRSYAVQTLGLIGEGASDAIPDLVFLLNDKIDNVRKNAILSLQRIEYGGDDFVAKLKVMAKSDRHRNVRKYAVVALEKVENFSGKPAPKPTPTRKPVSTKTPTSKPKPVVNQKSKLDPLERADKVLEDVGKWALVVGISDYADPKIPAVPYADKDAKAFYDWLTSRHGGGYPLTRVKLLINQEATNKNIKDALYSWLQGASITDDVTIFFSCHGSPETPFSSEELFILPYDADYEDIRVSGLPLWGIETALKSFIKSEKVHFIADVSRSPGVGKAFEVSAHSYQGNSINSGLQELSNFRSGMSFILGSGDNEISFSGADCCGEMGVFTFFLLRGLNGKADFNNDSRITLGELIIYLNQSIPVATNKKQNPKITGRFNPSKTF